MQTLLLQMASRASPPAASTVLQDGSTEASTGFQPLTILLMLLIAVATAVMLKIIGVAMASIAGAFKAIIETGLAFAGMVVIVVLIMFALTVILRSPI